MVVVFVIKKIDIFFQSSWKLNVFLVNSYQDGQGI